MEERYKMSSSERGGSQELVRYIKKSKMPIIWTANDDWLPHMKPRDNTHLNHNFADLQPHH